MSPRTRQVLADLKELSRLKADYICTHFNEALDIAMQIVEKKAVAIGPPAHKEPVLTVS